MAVVTESMHLWTIGTFAFFFSIKYQNIKLNMITELSICFPNVVSDGIWNSVYIEKRRGW